MNSENAIVKKSYEFAVDIKNRCLEIQQKYKEYVVTKQLLRSGTAVGALVRESQYAESKKDFLHKMSIALKEANESEYWLDLLKDANLISLELYIILQSKIKELLKLLISITKSVKRSVYKGK